MSNPVYRPVEFPGKGIDLSAEAGLQPVFTTPLGENVRFINPGPLRARGGSRCGLSRLIDDNGDGSDIQNLGVIVTSNADAGGYGQEDPHDFTRSHERGRFRDPTIPIEHDGPPPKEPTPFVPYDPDGPYTTITITPTDGGTPYTVKLPPEGDGYYPRHKGSTKYVYPPIARDDSATCEGDGKSVTVAVLSNDSYLGTPSISIVSGPTNGGTAVVTGSGASSQIEYTSKSATEDYEDTLVYRLIGTGNVGSDDALVRISVDDDGSDAEECTIRVRHFTFLEGPPDGFQESVEYCSCDSAGTKYPYLFGGDSLSLTLDELTVDELNERYLLDFAPPAIYVSSEDTDTLVPCVGA